MKIKPVDFWYRFENAFLQPLENAAQDLRRLIEETLDLMDHHRPEVDTTTTRQSVFGRQPRWIVRSHIDIYAPRKALPFFFFLLGYQSSRMCRIIMALNGIYPSGGAAPFLPTLGNLSIAPPNFIHRFRQTFQFSLEERVRHHHNLMTDMFDLIETHLPDINVKSEREGFQKERRKPWDHPQEIDW